MKLMSGNSICRAILSKEGGTFIKLDFFERGVESGFFGDVSVTGPGYNTRWPGQSFTKVDMRPVTVEGTVDGYTADANRFGMKIQVDLKPYDAKMIVENCPRRIDEKIPVLIRSTAEKSIARRMNYRYALDDRDEMETEIRGRLYDEMQDFGIRPTGVSLYDMTFPKSFSDAQEKMRLVGLEMFLNMVRAMGEAKCIEILGEAEAGRYRKFLNAGYDEKGKYVKEVLGDLKDETPETKQTAIESGLRAPRNVYRETVEMSDEFGPIDSGFIGSALIPDRRRRRLPPSYE